MFIATSLPSWRETQILVPMFREHWPIGIVMSFRRKYLSFANKFAPTAFGQSQKRLAYSEDRCLQNIRVIRFDTVQAQVVEEVGEAHPG